jgi:hypothetical protein
MSRKVGARRLTIIVLLIASALLFVAGSRKEHSEHTATGTPAEASGEASHHTEGAAEGATEGSAGSETPPSNSAPPSSERVLGINPESTPAVMAVVAVSALLGVAVWIKPSRLIFAIVGAAGLVFTTADILEAARQSGSIRAIAVLLAVMHLTIGVLAAVELRQSATPKPA